MMKNLVEFIGWFAISTAAFILILAAGKSYVNNLIKLWQTQKGFIKIYVTTMIYLACAAILMLVPHANQAWETFLEGSIYASGGIGAIMTAMIIFYDNGP